MFNVKKYKYISFDLFDTLIKRDVKNPIDVFKLVEQKMKCTNYSGTIENFSKERRLAEVDLYSKKKYEEISLDEIYNNFDSKYDQKTLERYKKEEQNLEISLTTFNLNLKDLYDEVLNSNAKIVITTDIYLPKKVICKILSKNNIKYDYLFVSSDIKLKKSTKNLYKYILKKLDISRHDIIHIGDNFKSDFINPKILGIRSVKVSNEYFNCNFNDSKSFQYDTLKKFINNRLPKYNDYYEKIGYEIFGPLLYGFNTWLDKELSNKNIKDVLFFSRDGLIIKEAFDILFEKKYNSKYFYASRRALIIPNLCQCNNLEEMLNNFSMPKRISIQALIKKFGLSIDANIKSIIENNNLSLDSYVERAEIFSNNSDVYGLLLDLYDRIIDNSLEEKKYRNKYFLKNVSNISNPRFAIVDIGWYGNMQNNFEKNSELYDKKDVFGYYVGLVPKESNKSNLNMVGYMFNTSDKDNETFYREKNFNSLFELFFSATHGSVTRYLNSDDVLFEEYEYSNKQENIINLLQKGAVDFIVDFNKSILSKLIFLSSNDCTYDIFSLGNNPTIEQVNKFGNLMFLDNDFKSILNFKGRKHYILHPIKFFHDFKNSQWKIGFLKKSFIINLPYEKICRMMRG